MKRIAVVDDEELLTEIFTDLFRDLYQVEPFTDPKVALDQIAAFKPDLLLLDWRMPGLRGPELATKLAEKGIRPYVLFITADHDVQPQDYKNVPNCVGLILKPCDQGELRRFVEQILS